MADVTYDEANEQYQFRNITSGDAMLAGLMISALGLAFEYDLVPLEGKYQNDRSMAGRRIVASEIVGWALGSPLK